MPKQKQTIVMPIKNKKSNFLAKGSAIVYALVVMAIVAILLTSILQYVVSQMKFNINRVERERAFQIAEAGVYYYRWFLAHKTAGMDAAPVSYTHLRAHETDSYLVCRLLLEK